MRIWLAPSAYHPSLGGIEELTRCLARQLAATGTEVQVLTNRWPVELPDAERCDGVEVRRVAMPAPRARPAAMLRYSYAASRARRTISDLADAFRPDVVHAIGAGWQAFHVAAIARRRRIPFVLNLQGETAMDDHSIYRRSVALRFALRRMVRQASAVTACSRWALEHAAGIAPRAGKGLVIPNGVDLREFAAVDPPRAGGPVLAYGRLSPNKGFDLLLAAWSRVRDARLIIGGAGEMLGELQRFAGPLGDRVRFLGPLDRAGVRRALSECSAVVMPSRLEPFGIVALEAMAAGRPVVAPRVGGTAEFLQGGVLVDPHDASALAGAVELVLSTPELGKAGRAAAGAYDWTRIAERWRRVYEAAS